MGTDRPRAMVIVTTEGRTDTVIDLPECLRIGRSSANDLVVDHQRASRFHSEIRYVGRGRYRVFDVGSRNGTWVNGQRVAVSKDLSTGDQITIANICLCFVGTSADGTADAERTHHTLTIPTQIALHDVTVVVLVSDIRDYTSLAADLPREELQTLLSEWFCENIKVIERRGGIVDKFIGDAVMVYWVVKERGNPGPEVNAALEAASEMVALSARFSERFEALFPTSRFLIGIGINLGEASIGNVGTGAHQSFTVVGDCVNVAFRLEDLTKDKNCWVVTSREAAAWAEDRFGLVDLGEAFLRGRKEPVAILGIERDTETAR